MAVYTNPDWGAIVSAVDKGKIDSMFQIGDILETPCYLRGQWGDTSGQWQWRVVGFEPATLESGVVVQKALWLDSVRCTPYVYAFDVQRRSNIWRDSALREHMNTDVGATTYYPSFLAFLTDSNFKNVISPIEVFTKAPDAAGGAIIKTIDRVFPLSYEQIGFTTYSGAATGGVEGKTLPYWKRTSSKVKYDFAGTGGSSWSLRSANLTDTNRNIIDNGGGVVDLRYVYASDPQSPACVIAGTGKSGPDFIIYGAVNGRTKLVNELYGSVSGRSKEITKVYTPKI